MESSLSKLLDISSLTDEQGFILSSSDDEEAVGTKPILGSKLADIFEPDEAPIKKSKEDNSSSLPCTIFSSVAVLYLLENGSYTSKGKCGIAVIRQNEMTYLVVYNASKARLAQLRLVADNVSVKVEGLYVTLYSDSYSISLLFMDIVHLEKLCAIVSILCRIETLDINAGRKDECAQMGDSLLVETRNVIVTSSSLEETVSTEKFRLCHKTEGYLRNVEGMKKGGVRIQLISPSTAAILTVIKLKSSTLQSRTSIEPESLHEDPTLTSIEIEINKPVSETVENFEESMNCSQLKSRVIKLGRPVLPVTSKTGAVNRHTDGSSQYAEHSYTPKTDHKIQSLEDSISTDVTNGADILKQSTDDATYEKFHRIVGIEMDRLQIRLEASMEKMITKAVQPVIDEMTKLNRRQEEITHKLSKLDK